MNLFPPTGWPFWRRKLILLQLRRWLIPTLLLLPYLFSLLWLKLQGLVWLLQIMLAPILMTLVMIALTWLLARLEFRRFHTTRYNRKKLL